MALQHSQLGRSLRESAAVFGVCEKTVRRWLHRASQAGFPRRLEDRSSAPRHQPRKTNSELESQILTLRRQRRSYAQIMMALPVSKATLSRVLRRHHLNRLSFLEPPKPPALRYERTHPGDLLHLDIKKLGRFARPGVRATGDRTFRNPGAGVESLHVAIDDHSRLAFACLLPDEKTRSVLDALQQAVDFYSNHGIQIQRVLTDRGSTYRSKLFAAACHQLGLKHSFTKPYRPQTNGKAERFILRSQIPSRAHGSCSPQTRRAATAPHSAVSELGVVRRCYTHPLNGPFNSCHRNQHLLDDSTDETPFLLIRRPGEEGALFTSLGDASRPLGHLAS